MIHDSITFSKLARSSNKLHDLGVDTRPAHCIMPPQRPDLTQTLQAIDSCIYDKVRKRNLRLRLILLKFVKNNLKFLVGLPCEAKFGFPLQLY